MTSSLQANRWELYRVLSEPVRLRLLALAAEEELAIGELAELLEESQPNVSRHAAPLRQAGLLVVRQQGTRTLVRVRGRRRGATPSWPTRSRAGGRSARRTAASRASPTCSARATRWRASSSREPGEGDGRARPPAEIGAYLARARAAARRDARSRIDAGTGDGGLLDVLAPVFERVVAVDRSEAQLAPRARARRARAATRNVDARATASSTAKSVRQAAGDGADVVFAVAPPAPRAAAGATSCAQLARSVRARAGRSSSSTTRATTTSRCATRPTSGSASSRPSSARFARGAGLDDVAGRARSRRRSAATGPDAHLPWQVMVAKKRDVGSDFGRDKEQRKANDHG